MRSRPRYHQVSLPAPYPGTEFYDQASANGWLVSQDLAWSDGAQVCPVQYDGLSAKEIVALRDKFYKRFYFRPKVMLRMGKEMMKDPDVRRRRLREGKEFLTFLKQHSG